MPTPSNAALPNKKQRQLQEELNRSHARFEIAFAVAQEMVTHGRDIVSRDPVYQQRYGEPILQMAFVLFEMAAMHLGHEEVYETIPDHTALPTPLPGSRTYSPGTSQHQYHALRKFNSKHK